MDKQPPRPGITSSSLSRPSHGHAHDGSETPLPAEPEGVFSKVLHALIHFAVRILAMLMVLIILWSVAGVGWQFYQRLLDPPFLLLTLNDILALLGAVLTVLIAIELFINVTLYIKRDALPLKMVVAIGLMAMVRKAIALDVNEVTWTAWLGLATIILALGVAYWLISYKPPIQKNDDYR